ncbi:AfsR/SARP family transcriptional regulator [Stackebrandtia nassauensis]|uniref:Transcriptional regulator, SARP family n=1 Tax=Stackebrandtia nassauensis (strain DSM 44728 / CIP 108903 / NRRL B-16338 / NBRC 102104 / LLR-40K-21) TaxID=446470 RepID=D3PWT8_STANL|nr:AfsR/SARP family transcriptional regulator [Stackebrandtia nassauensis]ADD45162.1 transcriptional regulator, SARP family [Stackebrandtia nassauensis DSM 44728]
MGISVTAPLRFQLLGPVRAWRDGEELRLGSPQQRLVLVRLLIGEGRPVSIDQLSATLWRDDPPPAARSTVRTYLSRLRSVLGAGIIDSREHWYSLRVGEVDAWRFAALLREAEATPDRDRARRLLSQALDLCQDIPLAELPGEWARAQRIRLEEERDRAVERRARLDLDFGRPADAAAALARLCAEYPLRERPHQLLMLALYRDGRKAEALTVHNDLRRRLAEQLGIDPGDETAELHRRILRADPELAAPPPIAAPDAEPPRRGPAQLLADIPDFTGRDDVVRELTALLTEERDAAPVVVVTGIGGAGKTTLATHVGHRVAADFPDGQLYVDLRGADEVPHEPLAAQRGMLRSLGVSTEDIPAAEDECAALFRSTMASKRLLLLLDNAADTAQVRALLPGAAGCAAIVTARSTLTGLTGARYVRLSALEPGEAVTLLRRVVGTERVDAESAEALNVVTACGSLPLAVRIAAARLVARPQWTVGQFAERVRDEQRRLAELRAGDLAVEAAFALSYRQLDEQHAHAFRLLTVPDAPELALATAAAVLGRGELDTEGLAEDLVDLNLLESPAYRRYRMHDLTRLFGRGKTDAAERDAALRRLADYYVATAYNGRRAVESDGRVINGVLPTASEGTGFASAAEAERWLDTETDALLLTLRQLARQLPAAVRLAGDLLRVIANVHIISSPRRGDLFAAAGAIAAAARTHGDAFTEGRALLQQADCHLAEARFTEAKALATTALELAERSGDGYGHASSQACLGVTAFYADDDPEAAVKLFSAAYEGFSALSVGAEAGKLLATRARILLRLGRRTEAVADAVEAVARLREHGVGTALADGLYQLGTIRQSIGDLDAAVASLTESLELHRALRRNVHEGLSLYRLAEAELGRGDARTAHRHAEAAIAKFTDIGDQWGRHSAEVVLGRILLATNEPARARELIGNAATGLEALGRDTEAAEARAILDDQSP